MSMQSLHGRITSAAVAVGGAAVLLLALANSAAAVPQIESTYGGQNSYLAADVNAMGGSGVALYRGGLSALFNPAFLVEATVWRLDLAAAVDHADEDRFQSLFDTFNSYVTDFAIASNRHDHYPAGFSLAQRMRLGGRNFGVGLTLADRNEFGYVFSEEIRDPDSGSSPRDRVLENRTYEVTGTLRDLGLGVATAIVPRVSVGATLHYAFGSRDQYVSRRITQDETSSYETSDKWDLSGVNATFGCRVHVNERLDIGLAYDLPLSVDGDVASTIYAWSAADSAVVGTMGTHKEKLRYPGQYRVGLTLYPRNEPRTVFTAELSYSEWNKLEDSRLEGASPMLQDVFDVRVGVQHTFYNGMRAMFGFRHYDSYSDRDTGTAVFSGGVGTPVAGGMLLASIELSKLQSMQPHIFPYPDGYDSFGNQIVVNPIARVEDTRFRVGLGYSRSF